MLGVILVILAGCGRPTVSAVPPPPPTLPPAPVCDQSLWQHVYAGRMGSAQARLKVIQPCLTVTGTIFNAVVEKDGDYHVRVTLDPQFAGLLNEKNMSGQSGHLVVEPICAKKVTQKDTIAEGVCNGFQQTIYQTSMKGKRVSITGAYVEDMEHGWREIHPVTSIIVIQ
jgi:hypothetical protein